jgi:ABC-type sugar transport system, permease component
MTLLVPRADEVDLRAPDDLGPRRRGLAGRSARWLLYAFLVAVFAIPLWSIVATALSGATIPPGRFVIIPDQLTLTNLVDTWTSERILRYFVNSLIVVGIGVPLQTMVSALAAYALSRRQFWAGSIVMLIFLCTMMMPEEVIAIPLYLVLSEMPQFNVSLLNTYAGMILPVVGWAFSIFVLTKFMNELPRELEEAARVDGATDFGYFWRVVLPCVRPALGVVTVFGFLMIWEQYLLPLIVAQDTEMFTLQIALLNLRQDDMIPMAVVMSAALLAMLPSVIVYLLLQRHFHAGITAGAVKG